MTRGVKQGDPLSPLLFNIAMVMSRDRGKWHKIETILLDEQDEREQDISTCICFLSCTCWIFGNVFNFYIEKRLG